jgi:hypothetical protein
MEAKCHYEMLKNRLGESGQWDRSGISVTSFKKLTRPQSIPFQPVPEEPITSDRHLVREVIFQYAEVFMWLCVLFYAPSKSHIL